MLWPVACIAFNIWLFRLGVFWGILGLNVTKHVMIAYLCGASGVDRRHAPARPPPLRRTAVRTLPIPDLRGLCVSTIAVRYLAAPLMAPGRRPPWNSSGAASFSRIRYAPSSDVRFSA